MRHRAASSAEVLLTCSRLTVTDGTGGQARTCVRQPAEPGRHQGARRSVDSRPMRVAELRQHLGEQWRGATDHAFLTVARAEPHQRHP